MRSIHYTVHESGNGDDYSRQCGWGLRQLKHATIQRASVQCKCCLSVRLLIDKSRYHLTAVILSFYITAFLFAVACMR